MKISCAFREGLIWSSPELHLGPPISEIASFGPECDPHIVIYSEDVLKTKSEQLWIKKGIKDLFGKAEIF